MKLQTNNLGACKLKQNSELKSSSQISFTGVSANKVLKTIASKADDVFGKSSPEKFIKTKIGKIVEQVKKWFGKKIDTIFEVLKKPFVTGTVYDDRAIKTMEEMKDNGIDISKIDRSYYGGMTAIDKTIKTREVQEKIDALPQFSPKRNELEHLKRQISMSGHHHGHAGDALSDISSEHHEHVSHGLDAILSEHHDHVSSGLDGILSHHEHVSDAVSSKADITEIISHKPDVFEAVSHKADLAEALSHKADLFDAVATVGEHHSILVDILEFLGDLF